MENDTEILSSAEGEADSAVVVRRQFGLPSASPSTRRVGGDGDGDQRWDLLVRFADLLARHSIRTWSTPLLEVVVPIAENFLGVASIVEDAENLFTGKSGPRVVR